MVGFVCPTANHISTVNVQKPALEMSLLLQRTFISASWSNIQRSLVDVHCHQEIVHTK